MMERLDPVAIILIEAGSIWGCVWIYTNLRAQNVKARRLGRDTTLIVLRLALRGGKSSLATAGRLYYTRVWAIDLLNHLFAPILNIRVVGLLVVRR